MKLERYDASIAGIPCAILSFVRFFRIQKHCRTGKILCAVLGVMILPASAQSASRTVLARGVATSEPSLSSLLRSREAYDAVQSFVDRAIDSNSGAIHLERGREGLRVELEKLGVPARDLEVKLSVDPVNPKALTIWVMVGSPLSQVDYRLVTEKGPEARPRMAVSRRGQVEGAVEAGIEQLRALRLPASGKDSGSISNSESFTSTKQPMRFDFNNKAPAAFIRAETMN